LKSIKSLIPDTVRGGYIGALAAATPESADIGTRQMTATDPYVLVKREALASYVGEYHHNRNQRCKADGQDWPCDTYKELRRAIDGEPTQETLFS
jgi:hypothetical protein